MQQESSLGRSFLLILITVLSLRREQLSELPPRLSSDGRSSNYSAIMSKRSAPIGRATVVFFFSLFSSSAIPRAAEFNRETRESPTAGDSLLKRNRNLVNVKFCGHDVTRQTLDQRLCMCFERLAVFAGDATSEIYSSVIGHATRILLPGTRSHAGVIEVLRASLTSRSTGSR